MCSYETLVSQCVLTHSISVHPTNLFRPSVFCVGAWGGVGEERGVSYTEERGVSYTVREVRMCRNKLVGYQYIYIRASAQM